MSDKHLICPTCNLDVTKRTGRRHGAVIHCSGAERVWFCTDRSVHHGRIPWHCPKCKRHLGCNHCVGIRAADILCDICHYFADGEPEAGYNLPPITVLRRTEGPARYFTGIESSQPKE